MVRHPRNQYQPPPVAESHAMSGDARAQARGPGLLVPSVPGAVRVRIAEPVWLAWTRPEHVKKWFAPKPYEVAECQIELRPGGVFLTAMRSPEGEVFAEEPGCVLEVVENQRFVWTSAMGPGFRPSDSDFPFTALITMESTASGTKYRAIARHSSAAAKGQHENMGFHSGWSAALDQLIELAKTL